MILNTEQLKDKTDFIANYITAKNAANGSKFDSNANVSCKNVATLHEEIHKDINIQIRRNIMWKKLNELFDEDTANEYIRQLESHEIYQHDETGLLKPYCVSISMYPLLLNGLKGLGGESEPPKHLSSYCGSFVNLMFAISSQFSGAVAAVEFLNYFNHFAEKDYGLNYLETNEPEIKNHLQHVIYALNQPAAARSYQAVFWNISIFDEYYFKSLFENFVFPDMKSSNWENVSKLQKYFMGWFNKEREKAILTFPVVTAAILTHENKPKDVEFSMFLAEELENKNSFFIYSSDNADSLSSCCRLRNNVTDKTFSMSSGAGGVSTGSINVITINYNKLIQKNIDLTNQIEKIHKYHYAFRKILDDLILAKMLPVYESGFININKQFCTIGLNGIVEAAEYLKIEPSNNIVYKKWISDQLEIIYNKNKEGGKKYGIMFNTEFVPAENLGVKNSKWDKKDGLVVARECYNSYFYPVERSDINVFDKLDLHGRDTTKWLDGGSAVHLNLEQYLTKKQFYSIICAAIQTGCNYFCTNIKITICEKCGNVDKETKYVCSKCGTTEISHATRIIGYLKKITSWSECRKTEHKSRHYH